MAFTKKINKSSITIAGGGTLFAFLVILASLSYYGVSVQTSGDQICGNTCTSYFNISLKNYSICMGNTFQGIFFDQNVSYQIYKKSGTKWNAYNFSSGKCLAKNTVHQFKLVGYKDPKQIVKWGLSLEGPDVDPFWYGINATPTISTTNMILELGNQINMTANLTGYSGQVCVDINHPAYNNSYACGNPSANFLLNISYFRNNQFNDSTTSKNFGYDSLSNQTLYVRAHQYDEIVNVSLNVTGTTGTQYTHTTCYQETATSATACGGLNTGSYWNVSGWFAAPASTYDGNQATQGVSNGVGTTYGVNYTVPTSANSSIGNTTMQFHSSNTGYVNISMPYRCINAGNLSIYMIWDAYYNVQVSCYNGTAYEVIDSSTITTATDMFEEGINWDFVTSQYVYPTVRVFVNKTLSNSLGLVGSGSNVTLATTAEGTPTKTINFGDSLDQTVYLKIPKSANITTAKMNLTGISAFANYKTSSVAMTIGCFGACTDNKAFFWSYSKPGDYIDDGTHKVRWQVKHGQLSTYNITVPDACNLASVGVSIGMFYNIYKTQPLCTTGGGSYSTVGYASQTSGYSNIVIDSNANKANDSDYNTFVSWAPSFYGQLTQSDGTPNGLSVYEQNVLFPVSNYTLNVTLDIGTSNGTRDFNYTGVFNVTSAVNDFSSKLNTFLSTCAADSDGYCLVPMYFSSKRGGGITISNIDIEYNYNQNPVYLNTNLIASFLNHSIGFTNIPITFQADIGNLTISDFRFDYRGGNKTYTILVHNDSYTQNETLNVTVFYSDFQKSLPYSWTPDVFFLPKTNNSKNVTAYGQTSIKPIFDILTTNYGGKNLNLSIRVNQTYACLNLTWNTNSTKPGFMETFYISQNTTLNIRNITNNSILVNVTAEGNFTHLDINDQIDTNGINWSSLVLYMPFDVQENTAVNTTYDYSKNHNDGTLINGVAFNSTGCVYGNCYTFNGSNYIIINSLSWISKSYWQLTSGIWKYFASDGNSTYVNGQLACPSGMAYINKLGGYCIDKYEASTPGCENVGNNCGNYTNAAYCPTICIPTTGILGGVNSETGTTVLAYSKAGVAPLVGVSARQSRQMCANAGKHLCTDAEWLGAANIKGQVYYLPSNLNVAPYRCVTDSTTYCNYALNSNKACNTSYYSGGLSNCSSSEGVYDMVGNVWEWTNETINVTNPGFGANYYYINTTDGSWSNLSSADTGKYGKDYTYFPANTTNMAVRRGGSWGSGANAGPFCAYLYDAPTATYFSIGFRCCSS